MSDAMAHYATRWTRRMAATSVYAYFVLTAARRLGLPWELHGILVHVLFLIVAIMAIVVILQIRAPVERAIASLAEEPHSGVVRRLPWRTLAGGWHLLALLYVVSIYVVWALRIEDGFRILIEATVGSVLILALGWVVWRTLDQLFKREEGEEPAPDDIGLPGFERRASRYRPVLAAVTRAATIVGIAVGLLEVWGFGTMTWLLSESGNDFVGHILTVGAIILISGVVWEIFSMMVERSVAEKDEEGNPRLSSRTRTLLNIIRNLVLVMLSVIVLFLVLSELGLDVAPLLAGAGVIGLAIGFGSQKLVQDIITGLFMLVGDTVRVGDVAEIAGKAGVVEAVSMRTVALRDYGGNVHTIPYSAIDVVTNYTKEYSYALFDIPVSYRENVDEVMDLLRTIGEEMNRDPVFRRLILEPLEVAGVDKFADSAVIIRARFKTRALRQWEVLREFNRRVKNRFDEKGIEIPLPHRTLYFGVDKQGRAPAARVDLENRDQSEGSGQPQVERAPPPASLVARSGG
jgi:small conductance mechanosensitive channel